MSVLDGSRDKEPLKSITRRADRLFVSSKQGVEVLTNE